MKKLLDSRFLFILALSLVVLIVLGIGTFSLYNAEDSNFTRSGYVLNPLSAKVEKYYFDDGVGYRENLSNMIEFKDTDNNEVTILKESFLHYDNKSLSFLANGAILDLDSINGKEAVKFYNITNKSMIEKQGDGYVIKTAKETINLGNFIGRISDNKYIVVGSLEAKIPGNESNIKSEYFEIVYTDEGVVNIENNDVKFQVTAEGTEIYVGGLVIDLGDKKIAKNNEDIMSLTAITINGNENIEIIPVAEDKEDKDGNGGQGDGQGNQPGNQNNPVAVDDGGQGTGTGTGNDGEENGDRVNISLKEATVGSTSVSVTFDLDNQMADDNFTLKVVNLNTGRTVDVVNNVENNQNIMVNLLSPDTKYLFTLINEKDGGKYFQKIFETNEFGIKLEKKYATDGELAFLVTVDENTDITNAKLSLYKYNEETKQNEIVKVNYHDTTTDTDVEVAKVVNLSSFDSLVGTHEIVFDMLDSNTIYTAVLDEFSVVSSNFKDLYNINLTTMTLKKAPSFNKLKIDKNVSTASFELSLSDIVDEDSSITKYTYLIYDRADLTKLAVPAIEKSNASAIKVSIGEGEDKLKNDTNYFYKVVIEYFDNEKYIEFVTSDSINFVMGSEPYVTVIPDNSRITHESIGATIYLIDNGCMISMPGRTRCDGESTVIVDVSRINSVTGERTSVFTKNVDFTVTENEVKYDLFIDKLQPGTTYTVEVRARRNDLENTERVEILHTDDSKRNITTKTLSSFVGEWKDLDSNAIHVVNINTKLVGEEDTGTLPPSESAAALKKMVFKLYAGDYIEDLNLASPIAEKVFVNTEEFDLKENFYDAFYTINSDETFGLDIDALRALDPSGNGKLSEYYTIAMYAYYDTGMENAARIDNNVTTYRISPVLLMENVDNPLIHIEEIPKRLSNIETNVLNDSTAIGYKISATFDRQGLLENHLIPNTITFYIYNSEGNPVNFYILDGGTLRLTDNLVYSTGEESYFEPKIYLDYGTDYDTVDTNMARGNKYYIGYVLRLNSENGQVRYPDNNNRVIRNNYGLYESIISEKENASVKLYPARSTANSITYKYNIVDPDSSLYKEGNSYGLYYKINDSEEAKLNITRTDAEVKTFEGEVTIDNLENGSVYQLYYKKNGYKTGDISADVLNYYSSEDEGKQLFDGFYDVTDSIYNFKYDVINNALTDNKVIIKILASDNMLNRILSYKVNFSDSKNNTLDKEFYKLVDCGDGDIKCFSVDYVELKNAGMKSENNQENLITVTVKAIYDTGLMGYDFTVGDDKDYPYMIMQNGNTASEYGAYISFSSRGQVVPWTDAINMPKGYYKYTLTSSRINYQSMLTSSHNASITYAVSYGGYVSNFGIMNPKMVDVATMGYVHNKFSFSSITPKIGITKTTPIINGAVLSMALSGADIDDFCDEISGSNCVNGTGEKYLYIELWDNQEDVGDRAKTLFGEPIKVAVNSNNLSQEVSVVVDKLNNGTKYYYQVFTYLNKNDIKTYTQLFDVSFIDSYQVKTYTFESLRADDIYKSYELSYRPDEEGDYNDKFMDAKVNLTAYANSVSFNYDIAYALCELTEFEDPADDPCGIDEGKTNIYHSRVVSNDLRASFTDSYNISDLDLEFDKDYRFYLYAIFEVYDKTSATVVEKKIILNRRNSTVRVAKLTVPSFVISREAGYDNGDYYIDFIVNVNDPSRVLTDGKYYLNLLDSSGSVVGTLKEKSSGGNYVTIGSGTDYKDYSFDATVANKSIRVTGLNENTKYTVMVFGEAFINNYSEDVLPANRTVRIEKSHTVYSTNRSGVAFGKDVLYSATEKSIVVTFLGGSNFDAVREVNYTIGLWDNEASNSTYSGSYEIGTQGKQFEMYNDTEEWRFVIDPEGMSNVLGQTYTVALSFSVYNSTTGEMDYYDSTTNPEFAGRAQYVKDNK